MLMIRVIHRILIIVVAILLLFIIVFGVMIGYRETCLTGNVVGCPSSEWVSKGGDITITISDINSQLIDYGELSTGNGLSFRITPLSAHGFKLKNNFDNQELDCSVLFYSDESFVLRVDKRINCELLDDNCTLIKSKYIWFYRVDE